MEQASYRYNKEPKPYRLLKREGIHFYAHFHPQIEIGYCISGTMTVILDGNTYRLEKGDVFLSFPNQRHYYYPPSEGEETSCYLLLFYPTHMEDYYREWNFTLPRTPVIRKAQLPSSFSVLWDLFYESYEENGDYKIFKAYATLLTAYIMPLLELKSVEEGYDPEDIQIVLNYINQHFIEDITLTKVAKALGFHPNRLSDFFNEKIGCNFASHIRSLRIDNARHLLRSTYYSINEVRMQSGFQSNRTFFRCFQEMYGMTPLEYRESKEEKKTSG